MTERFRLLLLSAMYENGGNTTHRLLDGHPHLFVYPFESQLGTRLVSDRLSSVFPVKYRWPVFDLAATAREDYRAVIDEELRVRARTPHVSKFRHVDFDFSDDERKALYLERMAGRPRSRASNVDAFFRATFDAWKNHHRGGEESVFVGYSPIVIVDTEKILEDFPDAHLLHVVRNPWSAYADTKKRPVPLSPSDYFLGWTLCQYHLLVYRERYPERVHLIRFEDVVRDPKAALADVLDAFGLPSSDSLTTPSFNGQPLEEVYPWGTIRSATADANRAAAETLSPTERDEIRERARPFLGAFDYEGFV